MKTVIIDFGLGNLASIKNMIKKVGGDSIISSDHQIISDADKLILPGVGNFSAGMENIHKNELLPVLNQKVLEQKTPVLGICLGMQLMSARSEEGDCDGLGWFDANIIKFRQEEMGALKVPHMGWNDLTLKKTHHLFPDMEAEERFYFVHSYHAVTNRQEDVLATVHYGYDFVCAYSRDNICGMQFHPEKSHRFGMEVFTRFLTWNP